ncbi:hypothetical protein K461DRAFT_86527 [Myriangium duriaei CBS 260.36]|uniref:Uncharacterized protein n=1 Tax=Myriangium duriaei CBS 260.36 TaxID=1168546 RepID=A0A9P4MK55_9PEZI|nr:hypothetical protein K461DRAFT_86527 [Myriangium duriaei CBS 260.36]
MSGSWKWELCRQRKASGLLTLSYVPVVLELFLVSMCYSLHFARDQKTVLVPSDRPMLYKSNADLQGSHTRMMCETTITERLIPLKSYGYHSDRQMHLNSCKVADKVRPRAAATCRIQGKLHDAKVSPLRSIGRVQRNLFSSTRQ